MIMGDCKARKGFDRVLGIAAGALAALVLAGCASHTPRQEPDLVPRSLSLEQRIEQAAVWTLIAPLEDQGATVALAVTDMGGRRMVTHGASRQMVPASVQKLGTAVDALWHLPRDWRWETTLYSGGALDSAGVLRGDLVLDGAWDPSLAGAAPYPNWPWTHVRAWADSLRALGITHIEGDLVARARAYVPGGWEVGDLAYRYAPTVAELMWNDGLVTAWAGRVGERDVWNLWPERAAWTDDHGALRAGFLRDPRGGDQGPRPDSVRAGDPLWPGWDDVTWHPVRRPRVLALDAFRAALRQAGIEGADSSRVLAVEGPDSGWTPLLRHRSAPLDSVLRAMLVVSSNAWAEQVAATVNVQQGRGEPWGVTWPGVLDSLGVDARGLRALDACGLARGNTITAATLADLLVAANRTWGGRWRHLLPRPGQREGTLAKRLAGLELRVAAKTGMLTRNRSLAGYVYHQGAPVATFVVMVNNSPVNPEPAMDHFVSVLTGLLGDEPVKGWMTDAVR